MRVRYSQILSIFYFSTFVSVILFPLLWVCACLHVYAHMCIWIYAHPVEAYGWCQSGWSLFYVIYWTGVSQSNSELVNRASLVSQLALGIPCFHLRRLELEAGHHTHPTFTGIWGSDLTFSYLNGKHFKHWEISASFKYNTYLSSSG